MLCEEIDQNCKDKNKQTENTLENVLTSTLYMGRLYSLAELCSKALGMAIVLKRFAPLQSLDVGTNCYVGEQAAMACLNHML